MKKIRSNKILYLIIFLITVSTVPVFASDNPVPKIKGRVNLGDLPDDGHFGTVSICGTGCTSFGTFFNDNYDFSYDYEFVDEDDDYPDIIKIQLETNEKKLAKFQLTSIYGVTGNTEDNEGNSYYEFSNPGDFFTNGGIISHSNPLRIKVPKFLDGYEFTTYVFVFKNLFNDPTLDDTAHCGKTVCRTRTYEYEDQDGNKHTGEEEVTASKDGEHAQFEIYAAVDANRKETRTKVTYDPGDFPPVSEYHGIDCSNYKTKYANTNFEYKFCELKEKFEYTKANNPKNAYEKTTFTTNKNTFQKLVGENNPAEFGCDPFIIDGIFGKTKEEYFVNQSYLHGLGTFTATDAYEYHYSGREVVQESVSCTVQCNEYVEVDYGPPIAAKAGYCFQYKVIVTSRVDCGIVGEIPEPKEAELCEPYPICSGHGKTYKQGGPNDDFDECIKSCDGGKYTDKCTEKCYNTVYGTDSDQMSSDLMISYFDKLYLENDDESYEYVANTGKYTCGDSSSIKKGYYFKQKDNTKGDKRSDYSIHWFPSKTRASWYSHHSWGIGSKSRYTWTKDGIPRSTDCTDSCSWHGCKGDVYLNPSQCSVDSKKDYKYDKEYNIKVYDRLRTKCENYTKCSTSQASFTISVGHQEGTKMDWVDYPYDKQEDYLQFKDTGTLGNRNTTLLEKGGGCYNGKDKESKEYYAYWGLPSTWHNVRTGEISFYLSEDKEGFTRHKNRFCIPENYPFVNTEWWLYYYAQQDDKYEFAAEDENMECKSSCQSYKAYKYSDLKSFSYNYNIRARTRKFGYFNWDIDIKCFYALYRLICGSTPCTTPTPGGGTPIPSNTPKITPTPTPTPKTPSPSPCVSGDCPSPTPKTPSPSPCVHGECPTPSPGDCDGKCSPDPYISSDPCPGGDCPSPTSELPPLSEYEYRVRSVNLTNLFPDKDGSGKAKSFPFNWSSYANNLIKDKDYISVPGDYKNWVEQQGYSVYSDEYLDYEINLDRKIIAQLRNKQTKLGSFSGTYDIDTGSAPIYHSDILRSGILASGNNKIPREDALKCNNIYNYSSTQCDYRYKVG